MADTIEKIEVGDGRFEALWGVRVNDYKFAGKLCDMQDLLVGVSQQRAVSIEGEVKPQREIITRRNKRLDEYGKVLQILTDFQGRWNSGERNDNKQKTLDLFDTKTGKPLMDLDVFWRVMHEIDSAIDVPPDPSSATQITCTYSQNEGRVSQCKSSIDSMNNDSQRDMNRLQAIVDRRDEAYSAATSLMTSVSDTRGSLIKNL